MNHTISIPKELYLEAKSMADALGVTVDEFAIAAMRSQLHRHPEIQMSDEEVREALNRVYGDEPQSIDPVLWAMQFWSLGLDEDEW